MPSLPSTNVGFVCTVAQSSSELLKNWEQTGTVTAAMSRDWASEVTNLAILIRFFKIHKLVENAPLSQCFPAVTLYQKSISGKNV